MAGNDPFPELFCHPLYIVRIQAQFVGNLGVRQIQPHEIQTQDPHPERLMMPRQHRTREIVKVAMATFTTIFLPRRLGGIPSLLGDRRHATVRATDPFGPAQLTDGFVALGIVQQGLKVDHRRAALRSYRFGICSV